MEGVTNEIIHVGRQLRLAFYIASWISYSTKMDYHRVTEKIESLLKEGNFWYERFEHEPVRTSEEAASVRDGYTMRQGAKALIVRIKKVGKKIFVMIVLPGNARFDTKKAKDLLNAKDIRFASPDEVAEITGGIVPGGVPPFGNLFNLEVYADESLFDNEKIVFNAGDKRVSLGMLSDDYKKIVSPHVVRVV